MTYQDKELLLKDLCGRLPYGLTVQISLYRNDGRKTDIDLDPYVSENIWELIDKYHALPYLRPMSSMTKDEKEELVDFGLAYWDNGKYTDEDGNTIIYGGKNFQLLPDIETYDWLNKYYFDYRGLIPKGLAIAVTEENNPYASN